MNWAFFFGVVLVSMGNSMSAYALISPEGTLWNMFFSGVIVGAGALALYRGLKP